MPSVKKIETTSSNETVKITTGDDSTVMFAVRSDDGLVSTVVVDEESMIEAVEEYAHERGLRRRRKRREATAKKPRKPRQARSVVSNGAADEPRSGDGSELPL